MKAGMHAAGELGSNQSTQSGLTFHGYSEQWKKACWSSRLGKAVELMFTGVWLLYWLLTWHWTSERSRQVWYSLRNCSLQVSSSVYRSNSSRPFMEDTALKTQSNILPICSSGNHAPGRLGQHERQSHIWEWFGMFYFSFGTRLPPHSVGSLVLRVVLLSLHGLTLTASTVHTIHSSPHSQAALWAATCSLQLVTINTQWCMWRHILPIQWVQNSVLFLIHLIPLKLIMAGIKQSQLATGNE